MKNPFLLTTATTFAIFPVAATAEFLGVIPSGVVTFPTFIGLFTASAVLAIAFSDYTRKAPNYHPRRDRQQTPRAVQRRAPVAPSGAAWMYRTTS